MVRRIINVTRESEEKPPSVYKLKTNAAKNSLPCAVKNIPRPEKDKFVGYWVGSKDRLRRAEKEVKQYEELLSAKGKHIEPVEQYSNEVVTGDIKSADYWKNMWRVTCDRFRIAEARAKLLRDSYHNIVISANQ